MVKVVVELTDLADGGIDVLFTSDTPLPEDYSKTTMAQALAVHLHDAIHFVLSEPKKSDIKYDA